MNSQQNSYVTGASGMIGSALCKALELTIPDTRFDLSNKTANQVNLLEGRDSVIHCAAIASSRDVSRAEVFETNVEGTKRLAEAAREAGVKRFVFLSSAKVFGEVSPNDTVFSDESPINPESFYGESKAKAEALLSEMHQTGEFEIVIIRPTVVVSPNAKGAVASIKKFAAKGLPFPVIKPESMRSFVSIENLCSAIQIALDHKNAGGGAFSVTDGDPVSTKRFYELFAEASGRRGLPLRVPGRGSRFLAEALGKGETWQRLFGNFVINSSHISKTLGWKPSHSTEEYLRSTFS